MLVLQRKQSEAIILVDEQGRQTTVRIVKLGDGRVSIGVEARSTLQVWREELVDEMLQAFNAESSEAK
jgi:sRNA-binding carbon storage regulator CsrA